VSLPEISVLMTRRQPYGGSGMGAHGLVERRADRRTGAWYDLLNTAARGE
jgi:hypothetical protein